MARGANITVENNFTRGLVTEFTAMNFPEQAVTETDNCVYNEFGEVSRRLGADFEPGFVLHDLITLSGNSETFIEYEWFSVGLEGTIKFLVQQIGSTLRFFSSESDSSLSSGLSSSFVNIHSFAAAGQTEAQVGARECQMTSGNGYLFVSHPLCDPFYVSYDQGLDTFTATRINVQVRDIEGIDDSLAIDTRPLSLSDQHRYNLLNQGWYARFMGESVLSRWQTNVQSSSGGRSDYPSNADIWWLYKRTALDGDAYSPGTEIFDSSIADKIALGNTPAPKGYYIYNAWNMNRTAMTGISGLPTQSSGASRPSSIVFYAGRVWYAGTAANKYSSTLYFSQLAERDDQFGRCYQINDPTSEATFDLIDIDGGTIRLPLAERVTGMVVINDVLLILATNCIYAVRGTDNGPFRATNYTIEYVSGIGVPNFKSVVPIDGGFLWWANDAIYSLSRDQIGIGFVVNNISKPTIQSFIDLVPYPNRAYIKGTFVRSEQIVRWVFSDDPLYTGFAYNRVLELNAQANAFYPYTLDRTARVVGLMAVAGQERTVVQEVVTDSVLATVTTLSSEAILTERETFIPAQEVFKFPTLIDGDFTFSEIWRPSLTDWESIDDGVSYDSYGISGWRVRGEMLRGFNISPTTFVVENVDDGSLLVNAIWDYGARESNPHQVYLFKPDIDYQIRKIKLRGKGRSVQIKFQSVGNNPFVLVGWSTFETGGQMP